MGKEDVGFDRLEKALSSAFSVDKILSREQVKDIICSTPGVPYPAKTTSEDVFGLLLAADFLEEVGDDKYRYNAPDISYNNTKP